MIIGGFGRMGIYSTILFFLSVQVEIPKDRVNLSCLYYLSLVLKSITKKSENRLRLVFCSYWRKFNILGFFFMLSSVLVYF